MPVKKATSAAKRARENGKEIGALVARFRESRGMTQTDLARAVGTSQSAIARLEKGGQNATLRMIATVSDALQKPLMSLASESVSFRIEGRRKLAGTISTNTAKNSATALLAASLVNDGTTTLTRMPRIEEVARIVEVLRSIGVSVKESDGGSTLEITPPREFDLSAINRESAVKTRSILMLAGALAHRLADFSLPYSGGCDLGSRTIRPHLFALEKLGLSAEVLPKDYRFRRKHLAPAEIVMYESGDTATENALLAAARIPGVTTIKLASPNYMVQDVCHFLQKLGVRIEGIGTSTLVVQGKKDVNARMEYSPSEDPTEAMFFIAAAVVTRSRLTITRCPVAFLELELLKLEKMGLRFTRGPSYLGENGAAELADITVFPSTLTALPEHIHPLHPGINTDNLPFFAVIATQAAGTTLIHDWVYEKRALYFTELDKLGANTALADPHRIFVTGPTPLRPAHLTCPPALRPATILLIAMLGAPGVSTLRDVYSINRGYEDLAERLNKLGAKVDILRDFR